jgi:hypothetical protein
MSENLMARVFVLLQKLQHLQLEDQKRLLSLFQSYIDTLERNVEDAAA